MQSSPRRFKALYYHIDYILTIINKPIVFYTAFFSAFLAFAIIYSPSFATHFSIFVITIIIYLLIVAITSGSLVREISSGEAVLYLVAGLRRTEYIISWVFAAIFFPILGFILGLLIPIAVISPKTILAKVNILNLHGIEYSMVILAIIVQLINNISLIVLSGLITRRREIMILLAITFGLLLPMIISATYYTNPYIVHIEFFLQPYYYPSLYRGFQSGPYGYQYEFPKELFIASIVISFIISCIVIAMIIAIAKRRLEV